MSNTNSVLQLQQWRQCLSKLLVFAYKTILHQNPEDHNIKNHHHKNLKMYHSGVGSSPSIRKLVYTKIMDIFIAIHFRSVPTFGIEPKML
jgi:hypothetical protein